MNRFYYFDDKGVCFSISTLSDESLAEELGRRNGSSSFIKSALDIPIQRARNINGELADVEPVIPDAVQWGKVREKRGFLLMECDWTQLPNSPLSNERQQEWALYRQALRDVTLQTDPFNIAWPAPPA